MKTIKLSLVLLLVTTVLLHGNILAQAKKQQKRPNIIFVYTDDQRYDALSVVQKEQGKDARFPWFKTPNIDRIANDGVRFRNSFVVNSLCSPSRTAFLTSKYNHLNGIANNHTELQDTLPTYSHILKNAGYVTGFFGKWHMANQTGVRPGFDYSYSFIGQGRYFNCPFETNGAKADSSIGWVDDVSTDHALQFIRDHKDTTFVLALAFKSGHGPFQPAPRHAKDFADIVLTKPATESDDPPYKGKVFGGQNTSRDTIKSNSWTENNDEKIKNYFRCLEGVDDNVGRLLDLLDSLRLDQNTLVVFSSDNGFFLGEHNSGDKRAAYEESIRTPLLARFPGVLPKGATIDDIVLNIDIAPTFLSVANIEAPKTFQGKSWLPLAKGDKDNWRKSFFYEYFFETKFNLPTIEAVRTGTAKLIKYPGQEDWSELYDLKKDPLEQHNLYNDPKYAKLKQQLVTEFKKQSLAVQYRIPEYADKRPVDKNGKYINPLAPDSKLENKIN